MDRFEFSQSLHPELGFSLKMNLQRFSEKFNLYFEGTCGQINTQATASFTYGFRKDIHDISINYTYIKLVIPVSYSIQTGRLRPDFVCGMNTTWPISPDIDRVITVEGESSYDPVYSTPQVNKWYLGGMARAGVSYHFQNNEVIFLHLGYEFTTGMTSEYGADVNSSFVMAGYYF
jgi:hypothetical protein